MKWLTDIQGENVAHMLASVHLVLRQQDGGEKANGEYAHVNNTSYEKFVERYGFCECLSQAACLFSHSIVSLVSYN